MDIPHRQIIVDIDRRNHLTLELIGHVDDNDIRYLDLQLTANDELIELEEGCTATVTYVSDDIVIARDVECDIEDDTIIIGFDREKVENARSGILKIQPQITDSENRVFTLQVPIYVKVSRDIAD